MRTASLAAGQRIRFLRGAWVAVALGTAVTGATGRPALAASCMDDVERLTNQLGVSQNAPPQNGATAPEVPATTESRGIPPEVTSRITGSGGGAGSGNPVAVRRTEVLGLLQAARAASAQGNEQECLTQLNKAEDIMKARQP